MTGKVINWRSDRLQSTRQIASIREIIHDLSEFDDFENHADQARSLLNRLKSKQRNSIIEAALSTHLQSELGEYDKAWKGILEKFEFGKWIYRVSVYHDNLSVILLESNFYLKSLL